jgi:DNA-binding GntR family transcriptional regulator
MAEGLLPELAQQIAGYIRSENLPEGTRLPARKLAERFRVSRTPVERALKLLEQTQLVVPATSGGYAVGRSPGDIVLSDLISPPNSNDEQLYLRLAADHTGGKLPAKASESELIRRYGASRVMVVRVLSRAANEGWAERLPGRGWAFVPLLTSRLTFEQAYRYRVVVEPAAIVEPTFVLDRGLIEACRAEQAALFDRATRDLSPVEVFESGSRFHQAVVSCSHNPFFINGLTHVNRVRRLVEYGRTPGSPNWVERCQQHVRIADLLLEGALREASNLLRVHLEEGAREKNRAR